MSEERYDYDGKFQNLHEMVHAARMRLAQGPWDYMMGGAETETTQRRNRQALDTVALRPRVLRDVSKVDATTQAFGRKWRLPIFTAPVGAQEMFVTGGAEPCVKGATGFGAGHMLSSVCEPGMEGVSKAAPDGNRIYQLYVRGDRKWQDEQVRMAIDQGYLGFAVTVDVQWFSRRERDTAKRWHRITKSSTMGGQEFQVAYNWDDIKHFKDTFDIPLIIKGIHTAEDTELACEHGVDWVYVSNHGGRQLDHGRGSLSFLPECVAAAKGRAKIMFDGGVMRGTDVVKAIGLGADLVGIGRLPCLALAANGEDGLINAFEILENEIQVDLGLMGATAWDKLESTQFVDAPPVENPHALSAFNLLNVDMREDKRFY